jgi:hypothetical protein
MEKFTLKIGKELRCYELDEEKKMLHITVQKRQKVTWKQDVDLQNVYANFYESAPEKPPVFKLIIAYMVLVLNILIMAAAVIFLAKEGKFFSWMLVGALLFPLGFAGMCWELICEWRHYHTGEFYFNSDSDEDEFEIYYLPDNRNSAYEFVCKVSQCCGRNTNTSHSQVIAEHEFENFYVKLFENDLALCDENGNEEMAIRYLDVEENVELIDKKHTVNNIIFGTLAAVFFGAALFLFGFAAAFPIYMAVKGSLDLAIILSGIVFIIFGCLPLALGKWFAGFCCRNEKYYFLADREPDSWNNNAALHIGKETADASSFIETLQKLIRTAHRKQQDEK